MVYSQCQTKKTPTSNQKDGIPVVGVSESVRPERLLFGPDIATYRDSLCAGIRRKELLAMLAMSRSVKTLSSFLLALMCLTIYRRHSQARPWRRTRYYRTEPSSPLPTWHSVESANHVELDRRTGRWSCTVNGQHLESHTKSELEMLMDVEEGRVAC